MAFQLKGIAPRAEPLPARPPRSPMQGRERTEHGLVAFPHLAALHHQVDLWEQESPWLLGAPHSCNQTQPELALN